MITRSGNSPVTTESCSLATSHKGPASAGPSSFRASARPGLRLGDPPQRRAGDSVQEVGIAESAIHQVHIGPQRERRLSMAEPPGDLARLRPSSNSSDAAVCLNVWKSPHGTPALSVGGFSSRQRTFDSFSGTPPRLPRTLEANMIRRPLSGSQSVRVLEVFVTCALPIMSRRALP